VRRDCVFVCNLVRCLLWTFNLGISHMGSQVQCLAETGDERASIASIHTRSTLTRYNYRKTQLLLQTHLRNGHFTGNQILNNVQLGATTSPPFLWSFLGHFEQSLIAGSDDLDSWNVAPKNDIDVHPRRLGFVNDDITIQHCFSNHQLISQYHIKDVLGIDLSFIFLRNTLQVNLHQRFSFFHEPES